MLPFEVATIVIFYQVSSKNSGAFSYSIGNHGASMSSAQEIWPLILALNGRHSCTSNFIFFCLQIPNMTQIKSQIIKNNKADDADFKSSMLILKKSNLVKQIE